MLPATHDAWGCFVNYKSWKLGVLPVQKVNKALSAELMEGEIWLSKAAHKHIAEDHPDDYPLIMDHLEDTVTNPQYIGQDPKHGRNFLIIKPVRIHGINILVAIGLEPNQHGNYNVRSAYTINEKDFMTRRQKGFIKLVL